GLIIIRPADANETVYAWKTAIKYRTGPVALALTRQTLPVLDRSILNSAENVERGAYILKDGSEEPELILMASGSEVYLALQAAEVLQSEGTQTRVVSFPSWELFEMQSDEYKESVLPSSVKARVSIEAGVKQGWEKYTGDYGDSISVEKFGASAPYEIIFKEYGITAENIVSTARKVLNIKLKD
ncbi:MAG TPA: transketolase C-terminal domain-containing protein, partial [Ignavibacteriaceae bacterium]